MLEDLSKTMQQACYSPLSFEGAVGIIIACCLLGIAWAIINFILVRQVDVQRASDVQSESSSFVDDISQGQRALLIQLGQKISNGAIEFLKQQYLICLIFVFIMFFIITFLTKEGIYTSVAFIVGAIVSIACGAIGMLIATQTNFRTTYCAKKGLAPAFRVAFRAGVAMGFALVSLGLLSIFNPFILVLILMIVIYKSIKDLDDVSYYPFYFESLFQSIAGYGLGGSFVALFGRVGGGIYTKAADVGADLVGKYQSGLPEDSPKNPATIADNVGDNVGDVAGMSADLFGSFAQSTCAALVLSCTTLVGQSNIYICQRNISNFMYPLVLIALGIFFCIIVSILATHIMKVQTQDKIQWTLKLQLVLSTILMLGVIYLAADLTYPEKFYLYPKENLQSWKPYLSSVMGLVSGMIIAAFTEFSTSHSYIPVRQLANSCKAGPASNVTLGLALGYMTTTVPVIFIALTAYVSNYLLGYYGVSLAALGMLSNLPLSLAIDGYGPISDNAGGIAEMAEMGEQVRQRTDGLDAAGNTTAAIGKGFAIGSAALVSLSLYGGYLNNAGLLFDGVKLTEAEVFSGLLLGAMLPYLFSAFTIRSVGKAAFGMVTQVRRQIQSDPGILAGTSQPDYKACIRISTRASLIQMIAPGALVILSPLFLGFAFGTKILAGFLPGAIVSGVQMAISASNTGGAWDNAKKYIESGAMIDDEGSKVYKGSDIHKAAVVGDTVGDPLKDTSGPALNILIKLMAILSLIFGSKFAQIHS